MDFSNYMVLKKDRAANKARFVVKTNCSGFKRKDKSDYNS